MSFNDCCQRLRDYHESILLLQCAVIAEEMASREKRKKVSHLAARSAKPSLSSIALTIEGRNSFYKRKKERKKEQKLDITKKKKNDQLKK